MVSDDTSTSAVTGPSLCPSDVRPVDDDGRQPRSEHRFEVVGQLGRRAPPRNVTIMSQSILRCGLHPLGQVTDRHCGPSRSWTSRYNGQMQLRELNVGCFGGGTGLPSLLGGLKSNPWLHLNAVVTMFDSGGSSGQLRDELGVLPPGDVLKCALALARNEGEARRVLLSRLPTLETNAKLAGHTGGNLLLSMMEQYSGNFLSAVDGLRGLLGCKGRVWPVSVEPASLCVEYGDGSHTRGEFEVDLGQTRGQQIRRLWLEPAVAIHPDVGTAPFAASTP